VEQAHQVRLPLKLRKQKVNGEKKIRPGPVPRFYIELGTKLNKKMCRFFGGKMSSLVNKAAAAAAAQRLSFVWILEHN
jgi:hypothetical protein